MFLDIFSLLDIPVVSGLLKVIFLILFSPLYAYGAAVWVFTFMWCFRFNALREWFNQKAGMEVVPRSRVDVRLLKKAAILYVGLFFFFFPGLIYMKMEYDKSLPKRGKRATLWRGIYVAMMMVAIAIIFALTCWAIAIMIFVGLASKVSDFCIKEIDPHHGNKHRCCATCNRRAHCGHPNAPASYVCGDYVGLY